VVKRDCYAAVTVEVDAANPQPVEAKLKALPRVLKVETTPPGATVLLDGKAMGAAPRELRLSGDPSKSHTVAAKKTGFTQAEQTLGADAVCVSDGKVGRLAVALALIEAPAAAAAPAASAAAPVAVKRPRPPRVEKPPKAEKPAADEDKPAASPAPAPTETKPPADTPPAPADPKTAKPKEEAPPKETPPKETPPADEHTPDWMK